MPAPMLELIGGAKTAFFVPADEAPHHADVAGGFSHGGQADCADEEGEFERRHLGGLIRRLARASGGGGKRGGACGIPEGLLRLLGRGDSNSRRSDSWTPGAAIADGRSRFQAFSIRDEC